MDEQYRTRLTLFISGRTSLSLSAQEHLREFCEGPLRGNVDFTVVDVLENPQRAEEEKVLATPTLIRESPPPHRRVIGDFSDDAALALFLGLDGGPGGLTGNEPKEE